MKLLLAIDGSRFSEAATQAVILEYPPQGLEVKVLNVVDLPLPIPTSDAAGFRELSLKYGHEVVDPNSTIIDQAKRWKADVIVMGSHGRKGVNRFLMGSVAETVSRHATCSVEIVRVNGH
jgi:hypothetical protein